MSIVDAFLATIGKTAVEVIEVPGIGLIGVRTSLTLAERAQYVTDSKGKNDVANALLLQNTVCDPDSHELIFKALTVEQINQLPITIVDPLIDKALLAIGVKPKQLEKAVAEELKNSNPDLN